MGLLFKAVPPLPSQVKYAKLRWWGLLLLVAALLGIGAQGDQPRPLRAVNGILDLRDVDLSKATQELGYAWRFHWRSFDDPASSPRADGEAWEGIGSWEQAGMHARPDRGYGTFRLKVLVDSRRFPQLAFATREQNNAYVLWVNGCNVLQNGTLGRNRSEEVPELKYRQGSLPVASDTLDLVLHVSNFHSWGGGMWYPIRIGTVSAIERRFTWVLGTQMAILGGLLVVGFFSLASHLFFTKNQLALVFALFCLSWAGVTLTENGDFRLLTLLISGNHFELYQRVNKMSYAFLPYFSVRFMALLFPYRVLNWNMRFNLILGGVISAFYLFSPVDVVVSIHRYFMEFNFVLWLVPASVILLELRKGNVDARILAVGWLSFSIGIFQGILSFMGILPMANLSNFGSFGMVLAQMALLAKRVASTYRANGEFVQELREKNVALERMSHLKDDFLANTSHELRTPLHGIQGIAEVALQTEPSPALQENLRTIRDSARRLSRLVEDILDLARLRHGELSLETGPVELSAEVRRIVAHLQLQAGAKGLSLELEIEPGLAVLADRDRLVQILFNLLGNAVKFTDAGGVRVTASRIEGRVVVEVRDTGIGISTEDRERIFALYEQGEHRRGGAGLGLAISRRLVELQGGRLEVESQPGKGSCFRFDLPWSVSMESLPDIAPDVEPMPSALEGESGLPTILVVDDEPVNQKILASHLAGLGYRSVCLGDGCDLLKQIEKENPCLILLDVMMPWKDGFEICREIRQVHAPTVLPVIFVTARNRPEDVVRGFEVGGNDYLTKPFLREELQARVTLHARIRKAVQELMEPSLLAVQAMQGAVHLWEEAGLGDKIALAEASGLWAVTRDANGWPRTQTLDKYLDPKRIPRNFRQGKVIDSVSFVLGKARDLGHQGAALAALEEQLALLKDGGTEMR